MDQIAQMIFKNYEVNQWIFGILILNTSVLLFILAGQGKK